MLIMLFMLVILFLAFIVAPLSDWWNAKVHQWFEKKFPGNYKDEQ